MSRGVPGRGDLRGIVKDIILSEELVLGIVLYGSILMCLTAGAIETLALRLSQGFLNRFMRADWKTFFENSKGYLWGHY